MNTDFILPGGKNKLDLLWDSGAPGTAPEENTISLDLSKYNCILVEHYDNSEQSPLKTASFQLCRVGCSAVLFKIGATSGSVYKLSIRVYDDRVEFLSGGSYYYCVPNKIYGVQL